MGGGRVELRDVTISPSGQGVAPFVTEEFASITLRSAAPEMRLEETDQTSPAGGYRLKLDSDVLTFDRRATDLWATVTELIRIDEAAGVLQVTLSGTAPELRFAETDQTDPAGRWRWRLASDILYLEEATTASWAADSDILTIRRTGSGLGNVGYMSLGVGNTTTPRADTILALLGGSITTLSIICATSGSSMIAFGDSADADAGILEYELDVNTWRLYIAGVDKLTYVAGTLEFKEAITIGTNGNNNMTIAPGGTGTLTLGGNTVTISEGIIDHNPAALTAAAPLTTGAWFDQASQTFTDSGTAGTRATGVFNAFQIPTFAATNAVTITDAATLYLAGPPAAGANIILTNAWTLWVDAGAVRFDGTTDLRSILNLAVTATVPTTGTLAAGQVRIVVDASDQLTAYWNKAGAIKSLVIGTLA